MTRATSFWILAACALCLLATGCVRMVPFTNELRTEHGLTDDEVGQLQFYVSHTITLRREIEARGRVIEGGHLELRAGKTIEEVVIEKKTPGVAVTVSEATIRVSFEEGSALDFVLRGSEPIDLPLRVEDNSGFAQPPNPFPGDPRAPVRERRSDLVGNYFLAMLPDASHVELHGKIWEAVADSFRAHLLIDAKELEEVVEERTVLKGRRIGGVIRARL